MQFLYPSVLWALLALSLPLVIHLFNFRKTKKVLFSNVVLLKTVETKSAAFRKLKHYLLMAARMLFIAALVLAFAQPVIPNNPGSGNFIKIGLNGIYLDNSLSMSAKNGNKNLLDLAVIALSNKLALLRKSNNVSLTTNNFDGTDHFPTNGIKLNDALTSVRFSNTARTLHSILKRQTSIAEKYNAGGSHQLFWISDFQKSTSGDLSNINVPKNVALRIIPLRAKDSPNLYIDSVALASPLLREMEGNMLLVKVVNGGNKNIEKLPLKLFIDGVQSSTTSVDVAAGQKATAQFTFTLARKGLHRAKISFDDQPVTFDNSYFFTLQASPLISVLHLFGKKAPENYLAKVYANDSLFNFKSVNYQQFDPQFINQSNLVILEGIDDMSGNLQASLKQMIRLGGSVLLIPSESMNVSTTAHFLSNFGIQNFRKSEFDEKIEIMEPDKSNPFFEGVFDSGIYRTQISQPINRPVYLWKGIGSSLLKFRNSNPLLSKTSYGIGNFYLIASPLTSTSGNFQEHAIFVPTFFRLATLSSKPEPLAYNFGHSDLRFTINDPPKNVTYKLKNEKLEIIPIQRLINEQLNLEIPSEADLSSSQRIEPGYFDVMEGQKIIKTIAINPDSKESSLAAYSDDELKTWANGKPNVHVYKSLEDPQLSDVFKDFSEGKALWKYFVWAAIFFVLVEILISKFMQET